MTVVPFGRSWRHASLLVVFADYQREYVVTGRPFAIREHAAVLGAARHWLETARSLFLPIAHVRQYRSQPTFNRTSTFADWIDGFRPRTDETLYERSAQSCYADSGFSDFVDQIADPLILLAGLSGDQACLATAIDAARRGHRLIFLNDCSATPSFAGLDEAKSHEVVTGVIERYVEVATSDELLHEMNARALVRSSA
jgi:nicotinamidase-related amidase